jgi:hypothetical protein
MWYAGFRQWSVKCSVGLFCLVATPTPGFTAGLYARHGFRHVCSTICWIPVLHLTMQPFRMRRKKVFSALSPMCSIIIWIRCKRIWLQSSLDRLFKKSSSYKSICREIKKCFLVLQKCGNPSFTGSTSSIFRILRDREMKLLWKILGVPVGETMWLLEDTDQSVLKGYSLKIKIAGKN